jgi:hypothetical protein
MQILLIVLLSLISLYLLGLGTILLVSALIIRQKLRTYQDNGRFGY